MTLNPELNFPKGPIHFIQGKLIILPGNDIDTDRIIPARFLKCVSFENLGAQVFADDRAESNQNHPFNLKESMGSSILIVGKNFGCGSSREHAPQALMRWGIRAIIGESFAEIFHGNCLSLGIPCARIKNNEIENFLLFLNNAPNNSVEIDLQSKKIKSINKYWDLDFEPSALEMLLSGEWDAISKLIEKKNDINHMLTSLPYLNSFQE